MEPKTIIITGADNPIGKATAATLAQQGHQLVLADRNIEPPREAHAHSHIIDLNLSQRSSIHQFTNWAHRALQQIDILINLPPSVDPSPTEREMTADGFEQIWFSHHLAPVLLTDRLLDGLIASPQGRIINTGPQGVIMPPFQTIHLKDPMFNHRPFSVTKALHQAKTAQVMHTQWLSKRLSGTMLTSNCIRMSNVRQELFHEADFPQWIKNLHTIKSLFSIPPEKIAQTIVRAALDEDVKEWNGELIEHPLRKARISAYEKDPLIMEQVMQLTYRQLGIEPSISFEPDLER